MKLELLIANLLKRHNCVIVPEFGGFIANYESAWINKTRNIIYPPYKQVLFNSNLVQNDGLLAHELMLKEGVLYPVAMEQISTEVTAWKQNLQKGERIDLGEIGFLYTQNQTIVFEQNREANLLLQAYGMKLVSFVDFSASVAKPSLNVVPKQEPIVATTKALEEKPVAEKTILLEPQKLSKTVERAKVNKPSEKVAKPADETPIIALNREEEIEAVEVTKEDQKVIPIQPKKKKNRNYKYAVAAAVILPALFYSYWIPMKTNVLSTGEIHMSDFNPFHQNAASIYTERNSNFSVDLTSDWKSWDDLTGTLPEHVSIFSFELDEETYIPVMLKEEEVASFNVQGSFHLIAGCFSVESNANNLVKELNSSGYQAGIVDKHKGLYRVSAGSFSSENEAESALDKFQGQGKSGWILKK